MKLNGWHRLWIVLSLTYLCVVSVFVGFNFPTSVTIKHTNAFYDQLPKEMEIKIERDDKIRLGRRPTEKIPKDEDFEIGDPIRIVEMANGHELHLEDAIPDKEIDAIAKEYWRIVQKEARHRQWRAVLVALLFWAGPVIIVYISGWSAVWIFRGFRRA